MIIWQIYIRNERIAKNLKSEQETTKKKIDSFIDAAKTGKLWEQNQSTPTSATPSKTKQTPTTVRPKSALPTTNRSASTTTRPPMNIQLDDFFQDSENTQRV